MKKLTREKTVLTVADMFAMRVQVRYLNAALERMRAELFEALGDEASALAGEYIIIASTKTRTDLDKEALQVELGERLKEFQKKSTYQTLEVKKA